MLPIHDCQYSSVAGSSYFNQLSLVNIEMRSFVSGCQQLLHLIDTNHWHQFTRKNSFGRREQSDSFFCLFFVRQNLWKWPVWLTFILYSAGILWEWNCQYQDIFFLQKSIFSISELRVSFRLLTTLKFIRTKILKIPLLPYVHSRE